MTEHPAPVTVLGLGPMGQALSGAFVAGGHPTTVWNRSAGKAADLVGRGAREVRDVAAAVEASPLIVTCVVDDEAVHAALAPAIDRLRGRTLVNLTSSAPTQARERAGWAGRHGIGYLAGAIMTPTVTIGQPSALVLYSGDEAVYRDQRATLAALGGTATYLGSDPGRAAGYDVALLSAFWLGVVGITHGLALARAEHIAGRDLAPYLAAIAGMFPEMATRFAEQVESGQFPGDRSTLSSAAAALTHITATASEHGMDSAVLDATRTAPRRALDAGYGAEGLGRLVEVLTR